MIALVGEYFLGVVSSILSLRAFSPTLPKEFIGTFDEKKYAQAQRYHETGTQFGLIHASVNLLVVLGFWFIGGFEWLDQSIRTFGYGPVVTGLAYIGTLTLASGVLGLPFSIYARSVQFPLQGIFVVDGSRRSSKANAFFTGFGKHKRIGLFDTLIEHYTVSELVAVVAHEVGHYKKRHIWKSVVLSVAHLGAMLWILSFFLQQEGLFAAFSVSQPSVYTGLLFFGLLFTPIELVLSILLNLFSRKNEFEADAFSAHTTGGNASLISALKKLSADNLSNLTPHWFDIFLHYSHPPVLQRVRALRGPDEDPASVAL